MSKLRYMTKNLQLTRIPRKFTAENSPGAPLTMSAARTSFGCWDAISVEDELPLETTGASWV